MAAIARPGGLVICFDADITGLFSVPVTECYVRLQALLASHQRLRGIDNALGLNLPRLLRQVGLVEPEMVFIHPVYLRGEGKRLWEYSFFEASPHIVRSGLTSEAELKARGRSGRRDHHGRASPDAGSLGTQAWLITGSQ
jgi:hypothetical protein